MAYQANRSYDREEEDARSTANNANNIRNAADVAIATKNPYAMAAGAAVKVADKVTGGKSSEMLGKGMTAANKIAPGGRQVQKLSNNLNESGASDTIGKAASVKNGMNNAAGAASNTQGGGPGSLPSSVDKIPQTSPPAVDANADSSKDDKKDENGKSKGLVSFFAKQMIVQTFILLLPIILVVFIVVAVAALVTGVVSDYDDAFGVSQTVGEETGGFYHESASKEQQAFYDRVNNVKLTYQAYGKEVDALKIVAIYHVLKANGAKIDYNSMNEYTIASFADATLDGDVYNEETFKNNLINTIIPKYLPKSSDKERQSMANEIIDYVKRYNSLVGKPTGSNSYSSCASSGTCSYDIKGYYIQGKGNVTENLQLSNVYVRLMECGVGSGHDYGGTFGKPLAGEELVPFEKYILGVAYQEIGDSPEHAFKAQMVAARSFVLARHADMGGWRKIVQEGDKWIIPVASCTQDQVYCNPDKGCSSNINGQWGMVYSGINTASHAMKPALPQNSAYRRYASETEGEVLVNSQGNIIYAGYGSSQSNSFSTLASKGLNYKQILLQTYNQGSSNYGATDVVKASCSNSSGSCVSTGDYASWKQCGAPWSNVAMGNSGSTICNIGCLVTSVSILIAKSGTQVNLTEFNPGTFVNYLSSHGGFVSGGNFVWASPQGVAPAFKHAGSVSVSGMSRSAKLEKLKELVTKGYYVVAEVKGNTGQHWVAIDNVSGDTIYMMDPGSNATDMWAQYNWANTSMYHYYSVG